MKPTIPTRRWLLTSLAAASMLAACGGADNAPNPEHSEKDILIDTAGRLAVAELNAPTLRIHDLDTGNVESTHAMADAPSAVYTSPKGRYAVVPQRLQDRVQFVDGGIWQEDHGDHLHEYKRSSKALAYTLIGPRPTHYDLQAGTQAAVFFDGNDAAAPVQNASVRLLTDASIGAGNSAATLDLKMSIHGLAEPVGDKLLTVTRASNAPDTLPTNLALYQRNGTGYTFVRELPTRCDGMHGSFSSGSSTVTGCTGGVLLVKHPTASTVSDGQLLATPLRVGTIVGHSRLPDQFIGIANEGAAPAPVTTRFYAVNGETATVSSFTPEGWSTGRVRRADGFDRSGQRYFLVDDQGTLIVAQRQGGTWVNLARIAGAIPTMPTAAPWPLVAANGAKDEVYITDPVAKQLVVVNSTTGAVVTRRAFGYTPSAMAWLGITR